VRRSIVGVVVLALMAASVSGATEQPPEPIATGIPAPYFGAATSGPFAFPGLKQRARPLDADAPRWARRLYWRSIRVLIALTDPRSGAMIAGERDGWDYVWPRDGAAGAIALAAAGLRPEAEKVAGFLSGLDLGGAARFHPDGAPVPGRPAAGDAQGWVGAAERAISDRVGDGSVDWQGRQDYGENVIGDLLGNAIASGTPADEILARFDTPAGLVREHGGSELDSSAAWAVTVFPQPGLRTAARVTLLRLAAESTAYGIPPIEGWTPGEVWTAPTAWSAWALVRLGAIGPADRLLGELHNAETPAGTLPERVSARDGHPTSTTPLAWAHAFAILALRARYG